MQEIKWDIKRGSEIYRVIYHSRLKSWISKGKLKRGETMVWRSGFSGWRKPEELPELAPFFESWEKLQKKLALRKIKRTKLKDQVVPQKKQIRNILIIDDEKDLCSLLSEALSGRGYQVATANTRREGLVCLKKAPTDLVFLDLKLPDGDGISVLSKIRQLCPQTIVTIISAYGSEERREEARKKGAYGFIDKPFTESDILKCIGRLRGGRRAKGESLKRPVTCDLRPVTGDRLTGK